MNVTEDLLREDPFASVVRPSRLLLPEDPPSDASAGRALDLDLPSVSGEDDFSLRVPRPRELATAIAQVPDDRLAAPPAIDLPPAPRPPRYREAPRRGIGLRGLALVGSLAAHLAIAYALSRSRPLGGLAVLMPEPAAASSRKTERIRLMLVDQPEAPPPVKPVRSRIASDADREARGGDLRAEDGHMPRLRGTSEELVFEPGSRQQEGTPDRDVSGRQGTSMAAMAPRSAAMGAAGRDPAPAPGRGRLSPAVGDLPAYGSVGKAGLFGSGKVAMTDGDGGAEGTVSFETSWFDWGEYATEMLRKIKWNWIAPHALYVGVKGHVRVSFLILRSGEITDVRLERGSGTSSYDEAAMAAIRNSSPLRALPADFPFDRERVTINFLYNMSRMAARQSSPSPKGS